MQGRTARQDDTVLYVPYSALEQRGHNLKRFKDFYLGVKARIWS